MSANGWRRGFARTYDGTIGRVGRRNRELIERSLETLPSDLEATFALYSTVHFRLPLPLMRGWALAPDAACELVREIVRWQPRSVLELGSGVSTLIAGYALEMAAARGGGEPAAGPGAGHDGAPGAPRACGNILSLEHEEQHGAAFTRHIADHGLAETTRVVFAPLEKITLGGETYPWYDCSGLPAGQTFDMLIIDGPPTTLHPMARYPALPQLAGVLAPNAVIILDDAGRPGERTIIERWQREHGPFAVDFRSTRKGMAVLTRSADAAG